jgi:hypothetical protein
VSLSVGKERIKQGSGRDNKRESLREKKKRDREKKREGYSIFLCLKMVWIFDSARNKQFYKNLFECLKNIHI